MLNITELEKALQEEAGGPAQDTGGITLWRVNGAGANDDAWRKAKGTWREKLWMVFATISWDLQDAIEEGRAMMNV